MTKLDKQIRQIRFIELLPAMVLAVVGLLFGTSSLVHAAESGPIRVHWLASNWAAFHGLARQCGERLELDEGVLTTHSHSRIWPLHAVVDRKRDKVQFYTKQTQVDDFNEFDRNLEAAEFDVLAVAVQLKLLGQDSLRPQYKKLIAHAASLAKKHDAQLVFATYDKELDGDIRIKGRMRLIELAGRLNAKVCPWWETMRLMKKLHPEVRLWDKKVGGHPSREMTYALSYAFYFTLTGRTLAEAPVSLQVGDWAPEDEAIELAAAAAQAQMKVASDAVQFIRASSERKSSDRYQSLDGHPADHLPPYIKQVSGFGERPEWSLDGKRILFVEKPMGEVYELNLTTGLIHPKTRHFSHFGFTRANYLANGDILLSGPIDSFDAADRESRREARHRCWLSVMPSTGESKPIALGTMAPEGPAVSRKQMKIAWTHRDKQDPTLGKNHARHFVADVVYESGKPKLANPRVVFDSRQLPFRLGDASLETQDFAGKDDRHLVFSVYQIEEGHDTDTYIVDTITGDFKNLTRSPNHYDEPEGVFPDGLHVCVEHAPNEHSAWPLSDIYKLKLDGSGEMQRLTSFSDFKGFKATQGVVSDDGKKLCFQIGKSGDEAGVGYGFFVMDLEAAAGHLEPFQSYASTDMTQVPVAAKSTVWVAVGYGGRRMVSRDMRSWTVTGEWAQPGSDDSNNLMGLTYADGKFVAVGGGGGGESGGGHVLISADGESWNEVWKAPGRINPIVYGKDRFIVGGPRKQLYISGDAKTWKKAAVLKDDRCTHFRHGAFGNGTFVITGNSGGNSPAWICATKDGESIAQTTFDIPSIRSLAFGNGRFVVVGKGVRMSSVDGVTWVETSLPNGEHLTWVIHTGIDFLCGGRMRAYRSRDGLKWSTERIHFRGTPKWTDGTNFISTSWPGTMFFSNDAGNTWQQANKLTANGINRVVRGER